MTARKGSDITLQSLNSQNEPADWILDEDWHSEVDPTMPESNVEVRLYHDKNSGEVLRVERAIERT